MPGDALLPAGATDTLNIRLACSSTRYAVAVVASNTVTQAQAQAQPSYAVTLQVPRLPRSLIDSRPVLVDSLRAALYNGASGKQSGRKRVLHAASVTAEWPAR